MQDECKTNSDSVTVCDVCKYRNKYRSILKTVTYVTAVHPPLLPLSLLCCACHRHPSLSRHPLPPSLVDCGFFHVHCGIAVHRRCSVVPTIAVDVVSAIPTVNIVPAIAAVAVTPLHLPLPTLLRHHRAAHHRCCCVALAAPSCLPPPLLLRCRHAVPVHHCWC